LKHQKNGGVGYCCEVRMYETIEQAQKTPYLKFGGTAIG
jgi:hypothetical protein